MNAIYLSCNLNPLHLFSFYRCWLLSAWIFTICATSHKINAWLLVSEYMGGELNTYSGFFNTHSAKLWLQPYWADRKYISGWYYQDISKLTNQPWQDSNPGRNSNFLTNEQRAQGSVFELNRQDFESWTSKHIPPSSRKLTSYNIFVFQLALYQNSPHTYL